MTGHPDPFDTHFSQGLSWASQGHMITSQASHWFRLSQHGLFCRALQTGTLMTLMAITIAERELEKRRAPSHFSFFNFFVLVLISGHTKRFVISCIPDFYFVIACMIHQNSLAKVVFIKKPKKKGASANALYTLQEKNVDPRVWCTYCRALKPKSRFFFSIFLKQA